MDAQIGAAFDAIIGDVEERGQPGVKIAHRDDFLGRQGQVGLGGVQVQPELGPGVTAVPALLAPQLDQPGQPVICHLSILNLVRPTFITSRNAVANLHRLRRDLPPHRRPGLLPPPHHQSRGGRRRHHRDQTRRGTSGAHASRNCSCRVQPTLPVPTTCTPTPGANLPRRRRQGPISGITLKMEGGEIYTSPENPRPTRLPPANNPADHRRPESSAASGRRRGPVRVLYSLIARVNTSYPVVEKYPSED